MAQQTKSGDPFREQAASRLLRAAANHIDASPELYEPIVYGAFPEFAPDDDDIRVGAENEELDEEIVRIDGKADVAAEIARLSKLSPVEFERERKAAAELLGVRTSVLEKMVKTTRSKDDTGKGRAFELAETKPWHEAVDGAALIRDMVAAIKRYVVLPEGGADMVALWALHSHCFDCFGHSPRLAIQSPEKGCGKTTLLDVLGHIVARLLSTSNVSPAAIFRIVEACRPTLLIDEADTFLRENDELRGILNSGHRKGGAVIRTVGDDHEPRQFSTWAPCAIALIGRLPDTLEDRSIVCALRRRKASDDVPQRRWLQFLDDCGRFLDGGWAARAAALGWGPLDLFGCDRDRPFARIDHMGLLWLLNGRKLVALTADTATMQSDGGFRLTFHSKPKEPNRVLLWDRRHS
jgi:hypothetical protein